MKTCEYCGKPNERSSPQAKFCSPKCNQDAQNEKNRRAVIAARPARTCAQCHEVIPAEVTGRARFCSETCRSKWFNRRHSRERTAARTADRANRPCMECGQLIPPERTAGAIYCSRRCKSRANSRIWRETAPGYMRQYLYGITPEQWRAAWDAQGGRCAICGTDDWPGKDNRPHADHDPETGRFRGILCGFCNPGLGMFKHDPVRLRAAAVYLEAAGCCGVGRERDLPDRLVTGGQKMAETPAVTLSQDTGGYLAAAGTGFRPHSQYEYQIFSPLPDGTSPAVGGGQFTTGDGGGFTFATPDTVAWYMGVYPGETSLRFEVWPLQGKAGKVLASATFTP